MTTTSINTTPSVVSQQQDEDVIDLGALFWSCVAKWKWFVLSIAICLALGVAYLLRVEPEYTRMAELLVKEDSKSKGSSVNIGDFSDLGLFSSSTNVNNEIGTIKSPDIMRDVVKRLHLDIAYSQPGTFHRETVYGDQLPVVVTFKNMPDIIPASFKMYIDNGTITLSDFVYDGDDYDGEVTAKLGDAVKTPIGTIILKKGKAWGTEDAPTEMNVSKMPFQSVVEAYGEALTIEQADEKSSIMTMTINDVSVQRAEDVLNTLIAVYNESWVKDKNQIAVSTSMFINDRLGVIEGELGHVDNDISSFKSANLLPDVQASAEMYMKQATDAQKSVMELNNQLYMARYIKSYLASEKNRYQLLPANSGIDDQSLATQINEYNTKLLDRNSLVAQSSTDNPLVVEMDKALTGLRSALVHAVDNQILSLNTQIRGQQATGGAATSKIASNPKQSKYLLSVERQQKVKESLYLYLLQKREENELSQAFTAYNNRVITMPTGSIKPTSPKRLNVLMVAFAFGLLIPAVIICVREINNTVIRGRKDLENVKIPFVGEIPQYASKEANVTRNKGGHVVPALVVVSHDNGDIINEAFRVVRTNVEFMLKAKSEDKGHVIMMLSSNPGSGKTFICYNLAKSLALKGKKVICVDLDMRKASLSLYIKLPKWGMSNYLANQVDDYKKLIHQIEDEPNMYMIPVGTIPPNPAELLFNERLGKMIAELRAEYDYVFIDCPPAEIVADSDIINKHVDDTLFVVRAGRFDRSMLPVIEKYYTDKKYVNMSLILNGTEAYSHYGSSKYGYGRYGYGYGYGNYGKYGYGHGDSKKKKA